ncbi:MAG: protein kinase [bacterium]|nr:protein kinase [bacterium]
MIPSEQERGSPVEPIGSIGGYELLEILSRSIVTTVYRGWQPSLNRPVLIKQLHPQLAAEKDIRARFEREARVIARVRQDNIVNIYDYSATAEAVYLVLEWVDGYNLSQILKRGGSLPAPIAMLVMLEILKGLEVAHMQEVIHRDIKPENILVSKDGRIKISDFGLALFKESPSITQQGMVIGTPSFMAPETITGGKVDARTDLFALGASCYELLTGERIFSGTTFSESLHLVLSKMPEKPSAKVRDIPPEIDKLVLKLLEKDPKNRPATAGDVAKQIRSILTIYQWAENPVLIRDYISDPAGFRMPRTTRIPLRRHRSIIAWGLVMLAVAAIAMLLHNRFQNVAQDASTQDTIPVKTADTIASVIPLDTSRIIPTAKDTTTKPPVSTKQPVKSDGIVSVPATRPRTTETNTKPSELKTAKVKVNGFLRITSDPWAVLETDTGIKETLPIANAIELEEGEHIIRLTNPKFPLITKRVTIHPYEVERLHVELWREVGAVKIGHIDPWADIYINGTKVASTPVATPIAVKPGTVTVKLVNPKYPPRIVQLTLTAGETSERINWNFENPTP